MTKNVIIAMLSIAFLTAIFFAVKNSKPHVVYDKKLIDKEVNELKTKNAELKIEIAQEKEKTKLYKVLNDSLQNKKPEIKYVYVTKSKEIDDASTTVVVDEFKNVFTNNGIK